MCAFVVLATFKSNPFLRTKQKRVPSALIIWYLKFFLFTQYGIWKYDKLLWIWLCSSSLCFSWARNCMCQHLLFLRRFISTEPVTNHSLSWKYCIGLKIQGLDGMLAVHNFSNGGSKDKVDEDGQPLQKASYVSCKSLRSIQPVDLAYIFICFCVNSSSLRDYWGNQVDILATHDVVTRFLRWYRV
jgi:hypothetical protein